MKLFKYTLLCLFSLLFVACEEVTDKQENKEDFHINILKVGMEPDLKQFHADVVMSNTMSALLLEGDTTVKFETYESVAGKIDPRTQPKLIETKNIVTDRLKGSDMNVLALVDLTVDSMLVVQQQAAVRGLKKLFSIKNFNVAFIKNQEVTETMMASDYVLDNYFKPVKGDKFLYRSVLSKIKELSDSKKDPVTGKKNSLIIFSDGNVYDEQDIPIDPAHFTLEHQLLELVDSVKAPVLCYVNMDKLNEETEVRDMGSENIMNLLCERTGGRYLKQFNEKNLLAGVLGMVNDNTVDYRFLFQNPDLKVYPGNKHTLYIKYVCGDSLMASDFIEYYAGSVYNPIIINGPTVFQVVMQGVLLALFIMFIIYILLQFILPFFSYLWFRKKYVTRYTGDNMSYNGILVNKECHFCKAPFEEGDSIVVKCKHVVHTSCWEENDYKCPEYGRNCKHGSHYFNRHKLYDPHNASFYMIWLLIGVLAGFLAWMCFTLFAGDGRASVFEDLIPFIYGVEKNTDEAANLVYEYGSHLFYLPFYGLNICFFLTLGLSLLVGHGRWLGRRLLFVIGKAIVGGIAGFSAFLIGSLVSIVLNFKDNSFLIDWIPWMLSGFAMTFIIAYGTDIKLKRALVGAAISIVFGLGSMYLWSFTATSQIDTRDLALLSYLIYSSGFAFSIATTFPRSERYFLRVEGPIKCMDIALYKWMNDRFLNKRVTIGKSVNCELQMTWDIMGNIAPTQAEVRMLKGNVYLIPLEEGVLMDKKPLPVDTKVRLYHGTKFTIGNTLFTYLEKDV